MKESLTQHGEHPGNSGHSKDFAVWYMYLALPGYVQNMFKAAQIVLLLDLSAAFDTVDNQILLNRLSGRFGIKNGALMSGLDRTYQL